MNQKLADKKEKLVNVIIKDIEQDPVNYAEFVEDIVREHFRKMSVKRLEEWFKED